MVTPGSRGRHGVGHQPSFGFPTKDIEQQFHAIRLHGHAFADEAAERTGCDLPKLSLLKTELEHLILIERAFLPGGPDRGERAHGHGDRRVPVTNQSLNAARPIDRFPRFVGPVEADEPISGENRFGVLMSKVLISRALSCFNDGRKADREPLSDQIFFRDVHLKWRGLHDEIANGHMFTPVK